MAFPASPTDGQTYSNNGVTYVYSAGLGVWNINGTAAIGSPVTSVAGRQGTVTLTAADIGGGSYASGDRTMTGNLFVTSGNIVAASGTASSSTTTGALIVTGGVGISAAVNVGGTMTVTGPATLNGGITTNAISVSGTVTAGTLSVSSINSIAIGATSASTGAFTSLTASGGLGVGTAAPGTVGQVLATNSITAYYSDERLKTKISKIENALDKIDELSGFLYVENDLAKSFGFDNPDTQVALSAQSVRKVQPEATALAPFDRDVNGNSKSGEYYLTVMYERLVPLLVEGIKELRREINQLKGK